MCVHVIEKASERKCCVGTCGPVLELQEKKKTNSFCTPMYTINSTLIHNYSANITFIPLPKHNPWSPNNFKSLLVNSASDATCHIHHQKIHRTLKIKNKGQLNKIIARQGFNACNWAKNIL